MPKEETAPRRVRVWADLDDPVTVFPFTEFRKRPIHKLGKHKFFENYVLCELVEISKRKRKVSS